MFQAHKKVRFIMFFNFDYLFVVDMYFFINLSDYMMPGIVLPQKISFVGFKVHDLKSRNLAPGESTTFKVTFTPKERNKQQGWIKISNDFDKKAFNIKVVGNGIPRKGAARASYNTAALMRAVLGTPPDEGVVGIDSMTTTETIDGHKYLVLTATKPAIPDGLKRSVEVSPNLVDWFSGPKHTTVIRNNGSVLKVRDNTPVTPGSKRYIRLKTSKP